MMVRRGVGTGAALASVLLMLSGCAAHGEGAATARAREQFADMSEQFATNAPAAKVGDFIAYVRDGKLDGRALVAIDENGDPNPTDVGIGGRSGRLIYRAKVVDRDGVLGLIVIGYDSPAGWGTRSATVYSCLSAAFDLENGGEPEYADAECIDQLRGSIATDTRRTLQELKG